MSLNGTTHQAPLILAADRTTTDGLFRDRPIEISNRELDWPRVYVAAIVLAGCGLLGLAVLEIVAAPPPIAWWGLAALTLLGGTLSLKIPSIPANFSISDVFTLTAAVAFGPAAGTIAVALDSLAISVRLARTTKGLQRERLLFNCAAPPLAMWLSAQMYFKLSGLRPLSVQPVPLDAVAPWLLLFAGLYFVLNTLAIAIAIALQQHGNVVRIWRTHFQNLWLTFVGGALGAAFTVYALQFNVYGLALLALPLLLASILHFAYRNATGRAADQLHHLAAMNRLHLCTIEALARAIDAKDAVTHGHLRRVQQWAVELARRMGRDDQVELRAIEAAALLHDVGKLAIPEHILNKPGKLTAPEFERIKTHSKIGAEILSEIEFPYPVVPIVRHHHENWDGTGYPDRIAGDAIPLGARILAVVDCYDALTSDRPYRRALSAAAALAVIEQRSGTMYDPAVVAALRDMCGVSDSAPLASVDATTGIHPPQPVPATYPVRESRHIDEAAVALRLGITLSSVFVSSRPWTVAADALLQVPSVAAAVVFRVDDQRQELVVEAAAGVRAAALATLAMGIGERLSGWVAATNQPMINADATLDLFDLPDAAFLTALAAPIENPDGSRMVMTLYSSTAASFSHVHLRLLEEVGRLVTSPPPWHTRSQGPNRLFIESAESTSSPRL